MLNKETREAPTLLSLASLRFETCGCAIVTPPWAHPQRQLGSHVLLLGQKGSVPLQESGQAVDLVPHRLVLLQAGEKHGGREPVAGPARYFWAHFTAPVSGLWNGDPHALEDGALLPRSMDLGVGSPLATLFSDLLREAENPGYTGRMVQVRFQELLIALTETILGARRSEGREVPGLVYRLRSRIAENLNDPNLSVKSFASQEGLNADYLSRTFKAATGTSIGEYVARHRIQRALPILETTRTPIGVVAELCGFGSDRNFLRQFKKIIGVTPGEYRETRISFHLNER